MSLKAAIRTPTGQLKLTAATLLGAMVFAFGLGQSQSWFEGLVREKYGEPAPGGSAMASRFVLQPGPLSDTAAEALYRHWMRSPDPALAKALVGSNAAWVRERVTRTLLAGSVEQRTQAVSLMTLGGLPGAQDLLQANLDRTLRMGPPEMVPVLQTALKSP